MRSLNQENENTRENQSYSYEEALSIIENSRRFGNLPGVEVSRVMLEELGNPLDIPFVHVAGTNGKGSTCAFLSGILMEADLKVGTFTSPHLVHFEERITVNGSMISKEDVTRLSNKLLSMNFDVSPTMFDYCMAMAVLYFEEEHCDIIIMETGLGGRLDSTNALGLPELSIITKIGLDHMAILGNSLAEIAAEKAGIMKKGSYLILQSQEAEAKKVLIAHAKQVYKMDFEKYCHMLTSEEIAEAAKLPMKLLGLHQKENAAGAIAGARLLLTNRGYAGERIEAAIQRGINHTSWGGRMEILSNEPFLLVDGAHNGHGVLALRDSLINLYPGEKFHFIMGVMADKDYKDMVKELLPLARDFMTVTVDSNRALEKEILADYIISQGVDATIATSMEEALLPFKQNASNKKNIEGKTICFGSLYFIGDVKSYLTV